MGRALLEPPSTMPCTERVSGCWMSCVKKTIGLVNFLIHQVIVSKHLNLPGKCVRNLFSGLP